MTPIRNVADGAQLALGMDAAWGGLGVCLADRGQPLRTWHTVLPASLGAARTDRLREFLDDIRDDVRSYLQDGAVVRTVVERIPDVYGGRGNQAAVGYGLGRMAGAIEMWAAVVALGDSRWHPAPWMVGTVDDEHGVGWRPWWMPAGHSRRKVTREAWKAWSLRMVESQGWWAFMAPAQRTGAKATEHAQEDMAEAILIACGASTRLHLAPAMPGGRRGRG